MSNIPINMIKAIRKKQPYSDHSIACIISFIWVYYYDNNKDYKEFFKDLETMGFGELKRSETGAIKEIEFIDGSYLNIKHNTIAKYSIPDGIEIDLARNIIYEREKRDEVEKAKKFLKEIKKHLRFLKRTHATPDRIKFTELAIKNCETSIKILET